MAKEYCSLTDLRKLQHEEIPMKYRLLYPTLFYSGMRPGEILKLKTNMFHKDYNEDKQKTYFFIDLKFQKNKEENELTPIREKDYLGIMDYCQLLKIGPNDYVFGSSKFKYKKPMSVSWLDRKLEQHCKLVGLEKKLTAHSFRSGLVTYLKHTQGIPYAEIATITRHQNLDVMKKHYDKRIKFTAYELIEQMEKI